MKGLWLLLGLLAAAALAEVPAHSDAKYNRDLVQRLLDQQQSQSQSSPSESQKGEGARLRDRRSEWRRDKRDAIAVRAVEFEVPIGCNAETALIELEGDIRNEVA